MFTLNPYLNFMGNTEEAFLFYKSIFGNEFTLLQKFRDTPGGTEMPEEVQGKLMHVALPLGSHNTLMGTDALESMGQSLTIGNNISLSLNVDNKEEADTLFAKLSQEGLVEMPLQDMFWGGYFGMVTDKFGIQWMINYDSPVTE